MATINLLPWREERRAELKKEFFIITGVVAGIAVAIIFFWQMVLAAQISNQQGRNSYLQTNINELNQQVKEIADLKKKKAELVSRMEVIQSLQGNRPEIVHIFDEMVRTLPDGVFYNDISRAGKALNIRGTAESNNRVSSLMRQLDASDWFADPNLTGVTANRAAGEHANDFQLRVKITPPSIKEE
ncbi:MAG TPA: PilN domain-containing protein [Pseudomonadales bacterium]